MTISSRPTKRVIRSLALASANMPIRPKTRIALNSPSGRPRTFRYDGAKSAARTPIPSATPLMNSDRLSTR